MSKPRPTFIINLDGLSGKYFDLENKEGNPIMPGINELLKDGVKFNNCANVLPAVTACNHTGIVTSAYPGANGIYSVGNYYKGLDENNNPIVTEFRPDQVKVKTILELYREKGHKTAVVSGKGWPARIISKGADILAVGHYGDGETEESRRFLEKKPDYWLEPEPYILGGPAEKDDQQFPPRLYICDDKDEFQSGDIIDQLTETAHFIREVNQQQCLALPLYHCKNLPSNRWVQQMASRIIDEDKPGFMYILFAGMDVAGHIYGSLCDPDGFSVVNNLSALRDQAATLDTLVVDMVEKIRREYDDPIIVLTSDHGMSTMVSEDNALLQMYKRLAQKPRPLATLSGAMLRTWMVGLLTVNMEELIYYTVNAGKNKQGIILRYIERLLSLYADDAKELQSPTDYSLDIRAILEDKGFKMRAYSTDGAGQYDWMLAEGPHAYIYNVGTPGTKQETIARMKQALLEYNVGHGMRIWEIIDPESQKNGVNRKSGQGFNLYNGECAEGADTEIIWPDIFIFADRNHALTVYEDILRGGFAAAGISLTLPAGIHLDLPFLPGFHGTYSEQHVPLAFLGNGITKGLEAYYLASTLDIAPTILELSHLDPKEEMPESEGASLVPFL